MRKSLLSIATLSAVVAVGTTSLDALAEEKIQAPIQLKGGYAVMSEKGIESLKESLKQYGIIIGKGGYLCSQLPGAGLPKPEAPKPEAPEPEIPEQEIPKPEAPNPENPKPESPKPEIPKPETPKPENPEPETPNPEVPEIPTPEVPDNEVEKPEALSYAQQVAELVNQERANAGLSPLTFDGKISAAANVRAKEIRQSFSHTRPNGSSFSSALREQGVSFRSAGENIAWGQHSPKQVMDSWMSSPGHRANILDKNFKNIGVGYYKDASGRNHWVQLFTQ